MRSPPATRLDPARVRQAAADLLRVSARADGVQPNIASSDAIVAAAAGSTYTGGPPRLATGDVADQLPARAAEKLRALRAADQDLAAALRSLSEKRMEAVDRRSAATARVAQLQLNDPVRPDHPSMLQAAGQRDRAAREIAEIDRRQAEIRGRRWSGIRRLEDFLSRRSGPIAEHDETVEPPKRLTLEAARDRVAELKADIHTIESAGVPSATVKARIRDEIERLAEKGSPNVAQCLEISGAPISWPTAQTRAEIFAIAAIEGAPQVNGFASSSAPDTLALFCWLHGPALIEKLEAETDLLADDSCALTDEERASRVAALRAQLLEAERIEVALISASEKQGIPVLRRNDADCRAVLNLASSLPAPR